MGSMKKCLLLITVAALWMGMHTHTALAQGIGLMPSQTPQKSQPGILYISGGRYVFGQISDSSKDQFMLDSATGRLWRVSETGEVGLFLNPVPYRVKDGKYSPIPGESTEAGEKEIKKKQQ